MTRPAVFLDRDGTLIEEVEYLDRLDDIALFPWTADAVRLCNHAGLATVVITNQSAVGRGVIDEPFLQRAHEEIDRRLSLGRAHVDRYYYCPHHPEAAIERYRRQCRCRKPGPGMIEAACADLDLDASQSWMIGDRWLDVACASAAGVRSIRVLTGHGLTEPSEPTGGVRADAILNNLMEAVGWILRTATSR